MFRMLKSLSTYSIIAFSLCSVCSAATITVPQPSVPNPLTLNDAVSIALNNHSSVGIAASQAVSASARLTQSNAGYYPAVTPSFNYTYQHQNVNGGSSLFGTGTNTNSTQTTKISVSQLLLDNGYRDEVAAAGRNSLRAANYNVEDVRQNVVLDVTTSYYNLLRNKELARVAQSTVDRTKTTLDATQAELSAGTAARKDVLQAQADYSNALVQQITANNNVRISEISLKNAMGIGGDQQITVPSTPTPAPPSEVDTKNAGDYFKLALQNRPDVQRDYNSIDAAMHSAKAANLNSGVQLQTTASGALQSQPNRTGESTVGLSLSYPLFDAGSSRAQARAQWASLEQTRLQAQQNVENIQQSVTQAYLQREAARQAAAAADLALQAARENYAAASESHKEGVSSIVDLITAQSALVTAETNAVQSIYDFYIADAQLMRSIGANDPAYRR